MERLTARATNLETSAVNQMGHGYIQVDDIDEAMEKLSRYEDTGLEPEAIEEIKDKGTPQKAIWIDGFYGGHVCPSCNNPFTRSGNKYCPECGQSIDW